jgi:hypothetical protein
VPRLVAAVALAVVLVWANGTLWRSYVWRLEYLALDGSRILPWFAGLGLRVLLCAALAVVAILALPQAWVPVVAALAGALVVVAPHLGRRPHPIAERR